MKKLTKITTVFLVAFSMLLSQASLAIAQTKTVGSCSEATLHGYISPSGSPSTVWFEWSTNMSSVSNGNANQTSTQTFSTASYFEKKISGLNENTTYYYRTASRNDKNTVYGEVSSFKTASCNNGGDNGDNGGSTEIGAVTNSASGISSYSARLNGYATTNGTATRYFEWGTSEGNLNNTTSRISIYYNGYVSAYVSGLNPNRTYYYRLIVEGNGKTVRGETHSFTTKSNGNDDGCDNNCDNYLSVSTRSASSVYSNSATLNGYVNTNNSSNVTRWFEWGRSSGDLDHTTSRNTVSYSGNASAYISGLSRNTTYYFRIAARGDNGTQYGSTYSFTTSGSSNYDDDDNNNDGDRPYATTRSASSVDSNSGTLNGYIDSNNGYDTYGWFEWGTSESNLSHTSSKKYLGSSDSSIQTTISGLSANTTYYYRAIAENNRGTYRGSILSFTTNNNGNINSNSAAPTPVTMLATNLSGSGATLNGLVLQSGNQSSSAWFEWGTSMALGRRTSSTNVGSASSVRHSEYLNGLTYGQTYYFRVVAENESGRNYGIIRSFVAKPEYVAPIVKPVVKPTVKPAVKTTTTKKPVSVVKTTTTVTERAVGESSLVMLTITGESSKISRGQNQTYTVTWRNTSDQDLRNVVLRVIIPQSLSFESADDGTYSKVENTHTLLIGNLKSGEEGEFSLALKGNSTLKNEDLVVTTANLVYTDEASIQGDALAYTTQKVSSDGSVLGASAGAASAPIAIIGWLILIILIIILAILVHNLYKRVSNK